MDEKRKRKERRVGKRKGKDGKSEMDGNGLKSTGLLFLFINYQDDCMGRAFAI